MGRRCWKAPDQGWGRRKGKGVGWLGTGVKVRALKWKQVRCCARRSWRHGAEWHSQVEKAKGKERPR